MLATLIVAGCSFEHGNDPGGPVDETGVDAATGTGSGSSMIACKFQEADLRLCIEFDDGKVAPLATDNSINRYDADGSNVNQLMRGTSPAAGVLASGRLSVGEKPMLEISQQITFETWLYLQWFPLQYAPAFWFVNNRDQYGISVDRDGKLRCHIGNQTADVSFTRETWHHVACVYDGSRLKVYLDGQIAKCSDVSGLIPTGGTQGTKLVDDTIAGIDDIRIYARALPATDICSHANKTACNSTCE